MCICINCKHINKCSTYHFIKKQHDGFCFNKDSKLFNPPDTIISVNIYKNQTSIFLDWDLRECASFVEEPGNWLNS
uniref:Ycf34 n=1 Tax=Vertebrata thuyoides TaxID=2006970 RepID=A0A1Z1MB92_9FLOR|nr:hypothetical protein [Vertebrata thuyoides]ARW63081.1 hypothetical protein [Vertebrata thuyoides]